MKKEYSKPLTQTVRIESPRLLKGSGVYTDDPQSTGNALSRGNNSLWDDDEE